MVINSTSVSAVKALYLSAVINGLLVPPLLALILLICNGANASTALAELFGMGDDDSNDTRSDVSAYLRSSISQLSSVEYFMPE